MAKKGSARIQIIVGGSSSSEDESNYNNGSAYGNYSSECYNDEDEKTNEDAAPTHILQPKEITKNIDLMKTVAMLMENKLQQLQKGSDQDKMRDLCHDIQRFPEAYQKFTSIIHQIQYLNVTTTTNWDCTSPESSNLLLKTSDSIIAKVFRSRKRSLPQDRRKRIMLQLLTDVQQVFNRYNKIQSLLESRLSAFSEHVAKSSLPTRASNLSGHTTDTLESEEDDPQRPLLSRGYNYSPQTNYLSFVEKINVLKNTLCKTKRSAAEVQDSIEVLRDLISWDYKQVISSSASCDEKTLTFRSDSGLSNCLFRERSDSVPEVLISGHHHRDNLCSSSSNRSGPTTVTQRKKVWVILGSLAGVLLILIATVALSFLRFNY